MSEHPFRTKPLDFVGTEVLSNYRTGNYTYIYETVHLGDGQNVGWAVVRNDGQVMGRYGSQDQAKADIPGFHHQDYLTQIQRWTHAQAHGVDLADTPLCLKEP